VTGLLTVQSSIRRMRCTVLRASGTVLWSGLLPASRETAITPTEQGQGGGVRQSLPLRRSHRGLVVGDSRRTVAQPLGRRT
jgi:hypothetical protein